MSMAPEPDKPPKTCGIAIMAKASIPGRAKTRLVPPLTLAEAADFNTAFLKDVAANIAAAAAEIPIRGYAAFGPPEMAGFFTSTLMSSVGLIEAWHANFGDCAKRCCPITRRPPAPTAAWNLGSKGRSPSLHFLQDHGLDGVGPQRA